MAFIAVEQLFHAYSIDTPAAFRAASSVASLALSSSSFNEGSNPLPRHLVQLHQHPQSSAYPSEPLRLEHGLVTITLLPYFLKKRLAACLNRSENRSYSVMHPRQIVVVTSDHPTCSDLGQVGDEQLDRVQEKMGGVNEDE